MNSDKKTSRLLGAAFLFVLVTGLTYGALSDLTLLSGGISDSFVNISNNLTRMRISILFELLSCFGIVVLAVLLFVVLNKQNKIIALVALGWWLAEAITLAVSIIGLTFRKLKTRFSSIYCVGILGAVLLFRHVEQVKDFCL